jgi:subtilase family serine protease
MLAAAVSATSAAAAARPHQASATPSNISSLREQLRDDTLAYTHGTVSLCAVHRLRCQAVVVTTNKSSMQPMAFRPPVGYGARELEKAYGVRTAPSRTGTIVVIGAGAYPTLATDLAIYRSTYGLPPCTAKSGCFEQMNYRGGAPYKPATRRDAQFGEEEIAVETALDVDMASAACPRCKIISMQVPLRDGFSGNKQHIHNPILHFATGVQTAAKLGARAVSISYGYPTDRYSDKGRIAKMMTHPGMPIVSSSGDYGFTERSGQWPQSLRTVVSAGGTSLYAQDNARGFSETAWNGAGSDCTPDLPPANGQPKSISRFCHGHRAASDISAVADPYTGVAVYDSYAPATGDPGGFLVIGGTSVASPLIAGLYARAPRNPSVVGPNTLYAAKPSVFNDVTEGTNAGVGYCATVGIGNAVCDARAGWDGPTGLGTPTGLATFR